MKLLNEIFKKKNIKTSKLNQTIKFYQIAT